MVKFGLFILYVTLNHAHLSKNRLFLKFQKCDEFMNMIILYSFIFTIDHFTIDYISINSFLHFLNFISVTTL